MTTMQSESPINNIDVWINDSFLPKKLEWIQNKEVFFDVYKNIKSWYWNNFSDGDIKLIEDSRKFTCAEYKWTFDSTRKTIAANRIDSALFRAHYPKFFNLDKKYIMGTIPNAFTQRKFREIVVNLEKRFSEQNLGELYNSDVEKIEERLQKEIKKQPRSNSQVFDTIYEELVNIISANHVYDDSSNLWNLRLNHSLRLPEKEIESMINIKISNEFEVMKNEVLSYIPFEKLKYFKGNTDDDISEEENRKEFDEEQIVYVKKYANGIFNDFAKQITVYWDWNIPDSFYSDPNTIQIVSNHMRKIINGEETSAADLVRDIEEELYNYDEFIWTTINNITNESQEILKKIDPEELGKITITDEELNAIKVQLNSENSEALMNKLKEAYKLKKYLEKKQESWLLTPEQETILKKLDDLFSHIKKRVLRDINYKRENVYINNYNQKSIDLTNGYATWNIKDIKPAAIVENNTAVHDYVYWSWELNHNQIDANINYSNIPLKKKIALFEKLKKQKQWDSTFDEYQQYLNYDLSINTSLVNASWIDMESVIENQKKIEKMIVQLAAEEGQEQADKKEINDMNIRKSCMICCFRAISKFFDTVNNNWENFASEFEINDLNENIKFDGETITIEWTIWANKNHIKLYYDTKTWELSFDNFLAYDSQNKCYKIWKWNNEKERINIKLPTMREMETSAKSIDYNLIDSLALNTKQYNRMIWHAMRESIRFECFQWFMWVNMEVNKQFVAQFNERNILKQEIIKSIYKKFYNINNLDEVLNKENQYLSISKWNEPEQFKLIKLISDSIDHYDNSGELLRFRQYVNEFDKILTTDKKIVEKDELLRYLFTDNINRKTDMVDLSKKTMGKENENLTVWNGDDIISHNNEIIENVWNNQINYYIFLDLLAEDKWQNRIINLDEFGKVLDIIRKINSTWVKILENKSWILRENYNKKVEKWEITDVYNMTKEITKVTHETQEELTDLSLSTQIDWIV